MREVKEKVHPLALPHPVPARLTLTLSDPSQLSLHLTMAEKCMTLFDKKKLPASANVEQVRASAFLLPRHAADLLSPNAVLCDGCDAGGQDAKDARRGDGAPAERPFRQVRRLSSLARLVLVQLTQTSCSSTDKLRIIALYIMHRDGVPEGDKKRLYQHARLALHEMDAVDNLKHLGVNVDKVSLALCVRARGLNLISHPSRRTRARSARLCSSSVRRTTRTTSRGTSLSCDTCSRSTLPASSTTRSSLTCATHPSARPQLCRAPRLPRLPMPRPRLARSAAHGRSGRVSAPSALSTRPGSASSSLSPAARPTPRCAACTSCRKRPTRTSSSARRTSSRRSSSSPTCPHSSGAGQRTPTRASRPTRASQSLPGRLASRRRPSTEGTTSRSSLRLLPPQRLPPPPAPQRAGARRRSRRA